MNIAIVGGGVGGLATAIALLKKGFNVQVYERTQALQPIGAGLSLTPNGLNSLNAIDPRIVERLKQVGSSLQILTLMRSTGETTASMPSTLHQRYGQPMLNIQWSKLQAILASELPSGILHLNHRCVGFEQQDGQITVHFSHQTAVQPDLLIGADGINSAVRQTLISDGFPNFTDRVSWGAIVQYGHKLLAPNASTLITAPDRNNFLMVDIGEGYTFWSASARSTDDFVHQRATIPKARVMERFADWTEPVGAIIQATPAEKIVERPICDRPPLQHWSKGSVTLLGDAAHPVDPALGQGANMAFEDAYELSECLAIAPNIKAALNAYENSRITRTTVIYDRSAEVGRRVYESERETLFHDMMNPLEVEQSEFEGWLYSYDPPISG